MCLRVCQPSSNQLDWQKATLFCLFHVFLNETRQTSHQLVAFPPHFTQHIIITETCPGRGKNAASLFYEYVNRK